MAPIINGSAIFNEIPQGFPVIDKTVVYKAETIDLGSIQLAGGIFVKALYLSIDPYLRSMMRDPSVESYAPPLEIGKPLYGFAVVSVIRSEKPDVQVGDILYVLDCPFREYSVLPANHPMRTIKNHPDIPLPAYLGVLGAPGMTAYYGLELIGKPKKSETIYVSSGASSVGSVVVQLAKEKGLKVIASASSEDKVAFMKSIGADVAFNYKTHKLADILAAEGPLDICWDNVGGSTLEAAFDACKRYARIIVCGAISGYNTDSPYGIKNTAHILFKRLLVQGLGQPEAEVEYEGRSHNPIKFMNAVIPLIQLGKLKWTEQVFEGIENVGAAIVALQTGASVAKVVVKVADM